MTDITMDDWEARILDLERELMRLRRIDDATGEIARVGKMDASRPPTVAGRTLYWAQVAPGGIDSRHYAALGTGQAYLCKSIGGSLYRAWRSGGDHHVTADVVNGATIGFGANSLVMLEMVDGQWAVIWADCPDTALAALPDEPH